MGIHIAALDEWVEYIPDVMDNRDDPDPMTVEIQPMNAADLRSFQTRYGPSLKGKHADTRAAKLVRQVLSERVRNVKGLFIQREIKTGEELADYGLSSIIDDVFSAIVDISRIPEGLRKKSE